MRHRTVIWQGVDAPRMEVAHVALNDRGLSAKGTQIGASYELRYQLERDRLSVEVVGGESRTFTLDGADFFDLSYSPLFNSLPVLRDRLMTPGPAREYTMAWISAPDLTVTSSRQRYEPQSPGRVQFRAGDFTAALSFDEDGLVIEYEDLAVRTGT